MITLSWKFFAIWKAFKNYQPTAKYNLLIFLLSFTAFTALQISVIESGLYSIYDDRLSEINALHVVENIFVASVLGLMFLSTPLFYNSHLKKKQLQTKTDSS